MREIVLTVVVPDEEFPLVDAAFLASLMHGMTKRDDTNMSWCIEIDGQVFDRGAAGSPPRDLYEVAQRVTDETLGAGTWKDPRRS